MWLRKSLLAFQDYESKVSGNRLRRCLADETTVSPEDRRRIIEKYITSEDFLSMAHDLGIKRTTAYTIIRHYQRTGSYQTHHGGGRRLSIDNESIDFLVSVIEAEPTIPIKNLNEILREVFPRKQRVSDVTVSQALQGELITLKLCHNIGKIEFLQK